MQERNLIKDLPIELVSHISSYIDPKSLAAASLGNKSFYGLFNTPSIWKYRLIKDFDVDSQLFVTTFQNEIKNNTLNYKQLYSRFYCFNKQPSLPMFIKSISRDITQQHLVLLACADNVICLEEMTREQQYIISVLAIYAGCFEIPRSFLEKHTDQKLLDNFLHHANRSGNLQLVKYLLNPENKFSLEPTTYTLQYAAKSGNLQLIQYLLKTENKFGLEPDNYTLNDAAASGNLQLVQYLINPDGLKPDGSTLYYAARSGNLQLIQYFLNVENKFELTPDRITLNYAARAGNLQLMQYLLNPKNKFALTLQNSTLSDAAESGNLQLVQYLLNPENNFGLKPNALILNSAAKSGNLQLVQYLLNPDNVFEIEVTQDVLNSSIVSKNFALSEYLLPSHLALQDALKKLQAHDITAAKTLLQKSYTACPSHYKMMLQYILNHTQCFNLSDSAMQCLKEHADALFENEKMSTGVSLNF